MNAIPCISIGIRIFESAFWRLQWEFFSSAKNMRYLEPYSDIKYNKKNSGPDPPPNPLMYTHYPGELLNLQKWLTWEPSIEHGQHIPELPQDPSERHFRGLILKKSRSRGAVARGLRSPSRSQPEGDYLAAFRSFWTHFYFELAENWHLDDFQSTHFARKYILLNTRKYILLNTRKYIS